MTLSHLPRHVINPHPDSHSCTQLKSCTLTNFCLRDKLYRDTAPVPIYLLSVPGVIPCHLYNLYRDRACSHYYLYPDGKKHAIPVLHRDSYLPKVPGHCPDAAPGNTTSLYCRAVIGKLLVPRTVPV